MPQTPSPSVSGSDGSGSPPDTTAVTDTATIRCELDLLKAFASSISSAVGEYQTTYAAAATSSHAEAASFRGSALGKGVFRRSGDLPTAVDRLT